MKTGFNWGQIFHFITLKYNKQNGLPKELIKNIQSKVPKEMYQNVRFSGTMSNFMNLHEVGYGTHDNTIPMWQQLSNQKHNLLEKVTFFKNVLTKNRSKIFSSLSKLVDKSYIYNLVESYKELDCKTMAFTLNTHMPYIGNCTLNQSLDSLKYIMKNTNLISVELGNETYFDNLIMGQGNDRKMIDSNLDKYFDYLEKTVVPELVKVIDVNKVAIGIPYSTGGAYKMSAFGVKAVELADKLIAKGYKVFLVPHIYVTSYDKAIMKSEIEAELKGLEKYDIRITEFNSDSSAGNLKTIEEVDKFIDDFITLLPNNVSHIYYHSIWTNDGAHFSYIK